MYRELSEQDVILKAITAPEKQARKVLLSLANEKRLTEKTNEKLVRKCIEHKMAVERLARKLVKSVFTLSVGMRVCTSRAITKWGSKKNI